MQDTHRYYRRGLRIQFHLVIYLGNRLFYSCTV